MASNKIGLVYFNTDTDKYQDIRIKKLKKDFGCTGTSVYDYILCEIYRVKGCFIEWDESTAFDVAEYFGLKESVVNEIVKYCASVGLFEKELLCRGIITSSAIQRRYKKIAISCKRSFINIPLEIDLINHNINSSGLICNNSGIIPEKSNIITEQCDIIPEKSLFIQQQSRQSKVKESKEKESNNDSDISSLPTTPFINSFPTRQSVSDLIDQFKTEEMFCENCMRELFIKDQSELFTYFDRFKAFLLSTDQSVKTPKDCKIHFMNWCRKNKSFESPQNSNTNQYSVAQKVTQPIPDIFYEKVKKLYPNNNFYSVKLFDQYMEYHGFTPEQALKHFERAYLDKIPYPILILRVQSEKVLLYKN
jgi:hypothetical protein